MERDHITDVAKMSGVSELEDALADDTPLNSAFHTRRAQDRIFCETQNVRLSIRLRGELRSHRAELLDISSIGAAVSLTRPLTSERTAFLTLSWGEHRINDVVCVISNCLQTSKTNALLTGYRCGLSFRPTSPLQLDRHDTLNRLNALADELERVSTAAEPKRAPRAVIHRDKNLSPSG